jgi:hypothetical protein
MNVNRGNQINATGTAERPIIFTSRDNVLGVATESTSGQWGGLVLSGRAPVSDCRAAGAQGGTIQCERQVEGAATPALFGGATADDDSGTISHVQLRYSGFTLTGGSELQSLTTGGTGSETTFDHIMSFNSSDDGAEFFGGFVNMKHFIVVGAEDDSIDSDSGVKANLQYVIVVHNNNAHDTIIEADSSNNRDAVPRQNTRIANFLFVQGAPSADGGASLYLRGGTDYALVNGLVVSPQDECLRIDHAETIQTTGPDEAGLPIFQSVAMQCATAAFLGNSGVTAQQTQDIFTNGSPNNSFTYTPTLTNLFVNGANESAIVATNPTTLSTFFDATDFVGAARASDTWFQGWTCNSAAADFGTGNTGLCSSLPVYQ